MPCGEEVRFAEIGKQIGAAIPHGVPFPHELLGFVDD